MVVFAGDWVNSKYITIDSEGWHCSDDAPDEIRRQFEDFMNTVNSSGIQVIDED